MEFVYSQRPAWSLRYFSSGFVVQQRSDKRQKSTGYGYVFYSVFSPEENLFDVYLISARLAVALFREDREELCDLSRGQSSLDSLNNKASQCVFDELEQTL
jgi:hypothetical protein